MPQLKRSCCVYRGDRAWRGSNRHCFGLRFPSKILGLWQRSSARGFEVEIDLKNQFLATQAAQARACHAAAWSPIPAHHLHRSSIKQSGLPRSIRSISDCHHSRPAPPFIRAQKPPLAVLLLRFP
ncbi:hypothetical protein M0R45_007682 [Rubus argutus]|uniref:Uncharacterized protein n=1 Tax=Rubus argutus TaxID=59490 RepID=A0AAW1XZG5_RUBAR